MAGFSRIVNPDGVAPAEADEFPQANFPVAYADGVVSASRGPHHVKIYLYRADPHPFARGPVNQIPIAQIVMPLDGFADTAIFFARTVKRLAADGKLTQKSLDDIVKACTEDPSTSDA